MADKLFPAGKPFRSHEEAEGQFGPLIFAPKPNCSINLLQCPDIAPRLPPLYPSLSLPGFLEKSGFLPSSAAATSSVIENQLPDYSHYHSFNSVKVLPIPDRDLVIAIFPAGENSDRVGFSLLSTKDGVLRVLPQRARPFSVVEEGNANRQRITRLLVTPVSNCDSFPSTVGILMVCTMYFVCWYRVRIDTHNDQSTPSACMDYLGCAGLKALRKQAVISSCWSPHFREECLVLLEKGDLLLFSIDISSTGDVVRKKMHLSLAEKLEIDTDSPSNQRQWIACEYSWHPRRFVVCHYNEVFLVDCMWESGCEICSLQKLNGVSTGKNDGFHAMARAGADGYCFAVTTRTLLLVLHVEKPQMPVVEWEHKHENPLYIAVFRLSELRLPESSSPSQETGHGIILGSFWDNKFSFFCYGKDVHDKGTLLAELSSFYNSYTAWGLPYDLSISPSDCECPDCIFKGDFSRESDPIWIDFRQRNTLVLGFGVLDFSVSEKVSSPDGSGGFILIRLTSSGILDAQPYHAILESMKISVVHKRKSISLDENHLFDISPQEYKGQRKFQHLRLDYLNAYLKGMLAETIDERRPQWMELSRPQVESSAAFSEVVNDISLPISINEVAMKGVYADLPTDLLESAFSTYSNLKKRHDDPDIPLEFMDIPEPPQCPPFTFRRPSSRSSRWSSKFKPTDAVVGPILPPQFLLTLNELCKEESKLERSLVFQEPESLFKHLCDKVTEHVILKEKGEDDDTVSLADDDHRVEDTNKNQKAAKFCTHKPSALLSEPSTSWYGYDTHSTFVFRRKPEIALDMLSTDMAGSELFDRGCPVDLDFDSTRLRVDIGPKEMETLRELKRLDIDFQTSFKPYQDYINSI